jgi:VanZ family protein
VRLGRRVVANYDTHMIHKLIAVAAWGVLAFIVYATLAPIRDRPTLSSSASLEHVAAFAVLGILFSLAYPRQTIFVGLVVVGGAVLLEVLQLLTPDRHGRFPDALEKVLGGVMGIMAGRAALYFRSIRDAVGRPPGP